MKKEKNKKKKDNERTNVEGIEGKVSFFLIGFATRIDSNHIHRHMVTRGYSLCFNE